MIGVSFLSLSLSAWECLGCPARDSSAGRNSSVDGEDEARSERSTASGYSDRSSGAHAYAAVQENPARPNSIA
ncbi:hypothetical protein B5V02_37345 [Mesorhizobium kowhaii]|uniref:Uncharacterized protein n=1 Tax=Mesorhizobium kowhaii TaxID=1300272 RepID=A0A2W7CA96_9HYPH|nr:hypothetical protein B5V02_37345 [Mesorhizobium kowhaii]